MTAIDVHRHIRERGSQSSKNGVPGPSIVGAVVRWSVERGGVRLEGV
jgi:hypothetical protein